MAPVVATKVVKVVVNTSTGSVTLNPQSVTIGAAGSQVKYELQFTPGSPNQAGVRAYVALLKKNHMVPDTATEADGYQEFVYAINDSNGNALNPTFVCQNQGEETILVTVLFPEGSSFSNTPTQSIIIMDW